MCPPPAPLYSPVSACTPRFLQTGEPPQPPNWDVVLRPPLEDVRRVLVNVSKLALAATQHVFLWGQIPFTQHPVRSSSADASANALAIAAAAAAAAVTGGAGGVGGVGPDGAPLDPIAAMLPPGVSAASLDNYFTKVRAGPRPEGAPASRAGFIFSFFLSDDFVKLCGALLLLAGPRGCCCSSAVHTHLH